MPNTHSTLTSLFSDIADAIRDKKGTSAEIVADDFPNEIASISTGITPSGNKAITASTSTQTEIDVTNYATVSVAPTPSETKSTTVNGDVTPSSGKLLSKVTVNVPTGPARTSSDLTVSGATVTAPAGVYSSAASKSVASGTQGTPTASKSISGHTATITPSCTDTTGYINGTTKTGTAVTVSASELVSGTKSITANGSGIDVKDYEAVDVAVPTGYLNYKEFEVTVVSDFNNGYLTLISADTTLAAHRADSTLFITITPMFATSTGGSILGSVNANFKHGESYWYGIRNSTSGGSLSTSQGSSKLITETVTTSYGGHVNIDSSGNLKWSATSAYYIRAGRYRVTMRW